MALLDYVDPEAADERTRELLAADAEYYDRPSLFARALAHDPAVLAARTEYHRRLVAEGDLDSRVLELVYLAVAATERSPYCVASHAERLVGEGFPSEGVEAVVRGDLSDLSERERAAVEFARRVAHDPAGVDDTHLAALHDVGFDDAAVVRLLAVAAAAVAAAAIADALGIRPADRAEPFEGDPRGE
ncbi:MAG: carboxymuconolactone decarboxylase family protein [Halobacteriaceae archaeon]